jgi:hypothetical protein
VKARVASVVLALALVGGACMAVVVAAAWNWVACENEGSEACGRQQIAATQLIVALVGVVPAVALVVTVALGRRRFAGVVLSVGVATYAAWAVLLDAAIHGWDDLKLLP